MIHGAPSVFVSSTMYDLSELRTHISNFIETLGWRAVMSEHDSFPIDPDQSTVDNSRRIVRQNADVFVMIVGSRYGNIDDATGKSITNLEFFEARTHGVPSYVFVRNDVLAQLKIWKTNPDADYSSVVDSSQVFDFIDSFYGNGEVWTFGFGTGEDVVNTLRQQFANLVHNALGLRKRARGQDRLLSCLEGEALQVALQRDENWEIRLFGTVLKAELNSRESLKGEIEHGLSSDDVTYVEFIGLTDWVRDRIKECERLAQTADAVVNSYLPKALGECGADGDPIKIAEVARRLAKVWEDGARWTLRCQAIRVDDFAERLVELLSKLNANLLEEIWEFGHAIVPRLDKAIQDPAENGPSILKITLTLTVDVDEFNAELERLGQEKPYI